MLLTNGPQFGKSSDDTIIAFSTRTDIAAIDKEYNVLHINKEAWSDLDPTSRKLVKLHEDGHLILDTHSEYAADMYAVRRWLDKGGTSQEIYDSFEKILTTRIPDSNERLKQILTYLLDYEHERHGNEDALKARQLILESRDLSHFAGAIIGAVAGLGTSIVNAIAGDSAADAAVEISNNEQEIYNQQRSDAISTLAKSNIESRQSAALQKAKTQRYAMYGVIILAIIIIFFIIKKY